MAGTTPKEKAMAGKNETGASADAGPDERTLSISV